MKVLMTADTVGGVFTYAVELCRGLCDSGVQVALATMGAPLSASQRGQLRELQGLEILESSFKLEWMQEPWDDVRAAGDWLLGIAARFRPDVVHLNGYAHGHLPWKAPVVMVAHSCVFSWFAAVKGTRPPPSFDRYRLEVTRGLRAADLVVAPTRAMLEVLEKHYGPLSSGSVGRVIPNGRSDARFAPPHGGVKKPIVFAAGRLWDEAKNISALVKVAPRLGWDVYVAGEARNPTVGEDFAGEGVQLLGLLPPEEVARWMSNAAIYALPARYEPFGLSALEAAMSGCALVLGEVPSLREVWGARAEEPDAALFVPPDDAAALTEALLRLEADADLREALARRAQARATRLSRHAMTTVYLAAYRQLRSRFASSSSQASVPSLPRVART